MQIDPAGITWDSAPAAPGPTQIIPPRPKAEPVPSGYRPNSGGGLAPIPGGPGDPYRPGGELDPNKLPKEGDANSNQKLQAKRAALTSLETQINRVDELYRKGFKDEALGVISSLSEYLPTDDAAQLNAAGAGLAEQGLAAFRVPGVGSQSDTELRQFVEANRPSSWDRDTAVEEKLRQLRTRVDATRSEMGLEPAQWLDSSRNVAEISAPAQEQLVPATGGFRTEDNPALGGVRGKYLEMLAAGKSGTEIIGFLRKSGITDPKVLRSAAEQVAFRRKNPNVPIENYNTNELDDMDVPLSGVESAMNGAAQSALGAYGMRAGNAITGNNLDSIVGVTGGNAERARLGLEAAGNAHPVASVSGDLSGGVMAALGGEAALARGGMSAGLGRAALADTGYGALAGAGGSDDGNRLRGAATGAAAGLSGSLGGQALAKTVGSVISPTGGNLTGLYSSGVRPTPGQRLVNAGDGRGIAGLIGRSVNAAEEGIGSVPIVGAAIRGARQDARDQWQVGAFNESLKEIGFKLPKNAKAGTSAHAFTQKAFDSTYNKAREGMMLAADEEMQNQLAELGREITNLAEPSAKRFVAILDNVVIRRSKGPVVDGAAYKKIQSELGKTIRGIRKNQSGDGELADALEELQGILDSAARRHSDPKAVELLDRADRGYAKFVLIENAAKARGGDAGTFTPTQFDSAVQRGSRRVRSKAYLQGEALMQDYAAQGMSLVDRMPNSGTADRLFVGAGAAGAAGYAEPTSLAILGGLGLAYAPGSRKIVGAAMAPRGKKAAAIADQVRKKSRIAGASGALLGIQSTGDR